MTHYEKTPQNTVKRGHKKAHYDRQTVHAVLDAAEVCHVAFLVAGKAHTQPINFGREDETIYLHGHLNNRMTQALIDAGEACLNVMHLDAMKLTRSAFHHSVNYRSATVFGEVREVTDLAGKLQGLKAIVNHFVPNRWDFCREPNTKELNATRVIAIDITSAVAKIADAPSNEKESDYELDHWAGIIPVKTVVEQPIPDAKLAEGIEMPEHIKAFYQRFKAGF